MNIEKQRESDTVLKSIVIFDSVLFALIRRAFSKEHQKIYPYRESLVQNGGNERMKINIKSFIKRDHVTNDVLTDSDTNQVP